MPNVYLYTMETFVMGDIHGTHKALEQCLQRSGFNKSRDRLIQLGDVTDSFDEVYQCVETLLTINNLVAIKGNHDDWFLHFIRTGRHPYYWQQGGQATAVSYANAIGKPQLAKNYGIHPANVPQRHVHFFNSQLPYFIDEDNNCFVHGGFNRLRPIDEQEPDTYYWDRDLWRTALALEHRFTTATPFNQIYIGHTPTLHWHTDKPMQAANVNNLDTGAGHHGRLTIMHVASKEYWQSDQVTDLYAGNYR